MDEKIITEFYAEFFPTDEIIKIEKISEFEGRYYSVVFNNAESTVFINDKDKVAIIPRR